MILKKKISVGLVGSGEISKEYLKIIKNFNHKVVTLVTKTNSKKNKEFKKKYKIKNHFTNFEKAINHEVYVDFWIICSSWDSLYKNLKIAIKYNLVFLIEKSLTFSSNQILKLIKLLPKKKLNNIYVGYNRNYYDFVPKLINDLNQDKLVSVNAYLPDSYSRIINKKGTKIKKYITKYITSHWISFIFCILKKTGHKIKLKKFKLYTEGRDCLKSKILILEAKKNKKIFPIFINLIPNNPSNIELTFVSSKKKYVLSPLEKLVEFKKINILKGANNQNMYYPKIKIYKTDRSFKPGLKNMYKDFIDICLFNKKKKHYLTDLKDLIQIYKICEILN